MIAWANANQGFVMAVLTLVYVIATLVLALFAFQANRTSQSQLELANRLERARVRPYVSFTLELRGHLVWAVLRNTGMTGALDVSLSLAPKLERNIGGRVRESGLTKHRHAAMPPGTVWQDMIDGGPQFFAQFPTRRFDGELSYSDATGVKYTESVLVDLSLYDDVLFTGEKNVANEIEKLRQAIERRG